MFGFIKNFDKNVTIVKKTIGAIAVSVLGILVISTASLSSFYKIGAELEEIAEYQVPLNTVIVELEKDILQEEILTLELLIASKDVNSKAFKDIEHHIEELEKKTDKKIKEAEDLVEKAIEHNTDEKTKKTYKLFFTELKEIEKEQKHFKEALKILVKDLKSGNLQNLKHEQEVVLKDLKLMEKNIIKLMHQLEELLEHSTHQAEQDEKAAIMNIFVINIVVLIAAIFMGIILSRTIKKRFKHFENGLDRFFKYVNRETTSFSAIEITNNDEISKMSERLNANIEYVNKELQDDMKVMGEIVITLDKVEQGIYSCKIHSNTKNPMIATLRNTINKMLDNVNKDMTQLRTTLEEYAEDNFSNKVNINPKLKADMLAVMESVNKLGNSLSHSAKANLSNGQQLETNAATMTDSVANLAEKANQQAASLEETAAAVEEITSITRNNANNAAKMSELGQKVKKEVSSGMDLANNTSSSMDEINEQVTAIAEAITVIDQIAFQTNILSLNAAVEAATAGEAGKGFAVVAQEVRNLAARSADAANEIKEIVENAREKANEGKSVSDQMIKGYEVLNDNFSETITLIDDVSSASKEQMTGIEQINDAVTMLDRVTQENASEANSVASIAGEVSSMANDLVTDAKSKKFN